MSPSFGPGSFGTAFDILAKRDCKIGALIGTGGQAATQLEGMLAARQLEVVGSMI